MTALFSDQELRHVALNAMGRASEVGAAAGFQLGFASNFKNGMPENNSGYTLGYMQVDFGAHPDKTPPLVNAYNVWAQENEKMIIADVDNANYLLQQNKNKVKKLQEDDPNIKYVDIRKNDHPLGKQLREFLGTEAGFDYIMSLQESAYKDIEKNMKDVIATESFKNMNREEQIQVLSVVAKISNQAGPTIRNSNGTLFPAGKMVTLLTEAESPITFSTFKTGAEANVRNIGYLKSGFEDTMKGAEIYNTLANDTGALGEMFKDRLEQNPYELTKEEFVANPHEQFMDTLFRYPDQATKIMNALDNNKDIVINPTGPSYLSKDIKNETYTIGVKDGALFSIDKDGNAHKMDDKGQWIAFDNDKNPLIHHDAKGEWTLTPRDLAQDHKGPDVLELQEKLNALGHPVTINEKEPTYDQSTTDQVKGFQKANGLTISGKIDGATRTAIDQQLNEQNKHLPFVRSNDSLQKTNQEITTKLDHINELNDQYKDYDRDSAGIGKVAIANNIHEGQVAIAQLELDKADYINSEQAKLLAEKAPHETAIQNADTVLDALKAQALLTPSEISGVPTLQTAMEAQKAEATAALEQISEKYNALENQKSSVIEQQIAGETNKIDQLNDNIRDYDQQQIEPLKAIQQQLADHTQSTANAANNSSESESSTTTSAYQAVEKELTAANISPLTPEQTAFYSSTKVLSQKGKSNSIDDVKAVQEFLIEKEYLAPTWTDKKGVEHPSDDGNFGGGTHDALKAYQLAQGLEDDGAVGKDVRNAMKSDELSKFTTDDIDKIVQAEIDARTDNKETAITEMNNEIKDAQTHIDQLQIEQTTMLSNQLEIQQAEQQALTQKIEDNQHSVQSLDTLKESLIQSPDLSHHLYEEMRNTHDIEITPNQPESFVHTVLDSKKAALETEIKVDQAQLAALKPEIANTKEQLTERGITPPEIKEPVLEAKIEPEVAQAPISEEVKEKAQTVDELSREIKEPVIEAKADPEVAQSPISEPMAAVQPENRLLGTATTGDPDIDRILEARLSGNHEETIRLSIEVAQRPDMQELKQELLAEAHQTNLQIAEQQREQQELARQQALQIEQEIKEQQEKQLANRGPSMSR